MTRRILVLVAALVALFAPAGSGYQEFHAPSVPMPGSGGWPDGLKELVNCDARTVGITGFADSWAYYAGDATALNIFLNSYGKIRDARLQVVLHPGRMRVRASFDATEPTVDVDWSLDILEWHAGRGNESAFEGAKVLTVVHIWLGGQIELDTLDVPTNIDVRSGGEIERFARNHKQKQKEATPDEQ
jgi:hypothetical protein